MGSSGLCCCLEVFKGNLSTVLSMCLLCRAGSPGRAPSSKTQTASHHRDYYQQLAAGTYCTFINFMCYVEGNPLIITNFLCYMDSSPLMITNN